MGISARCCQDGFWVRFEEGKSLDGVDLLPDRQLIAAGPDVVPATPVCDATASEGYDDRDNGSQIPEA